jgi:hypothetical protein
MKCGILTEERWQRLLDDRLTQEESAELRMHLSSDCQACESFFAEMDEATEERLRLIFQNVSPSDRIPVTAEARKAFREVMQQVREARTLPVWRRFPAPRWAGAMAASVLVVIGSLLYWNALQQPAQTEKGPATLIPAIELEFAIGHRQADGRLSVDRGELGKSYNPSDLLFLRFQNPAGGYIYLLGRQGDATELLFPKKPDRVRPLPAGEHLIPSGDQPAGIPLQGLEGRYMVVVVYSPKPLDHEQIISLINQSVDPSTGSVNREALSRIGEGIAMDTVYFDVHA